MIYQNRPEKFNPVFKVVGCWCECDEKTLFIQRHTSKPEGGTWATPAGKVNKNEDPASAMLRELYEETGLKAREKDLILFRKVFVKYHNYDFDYYIFKYKLHQLPEIILNPKEHTDFKWLYPKDALRLPLIEDEEACIELIYNVK
jgi:8-oxo-dGTP diphosphatase